MNIVFGIELTNDLIELTDTSIVNDEIDDSGHTCCSFSSLLVTVKRSLWKLALEVSSGGGG